MIDGGGGDELKKLVGREVFAGGISRHDDI